MPRKKTAPQGYKETATGKEIIRESNITGASEKDLGVILSLDLKPEKHISLVVHKASNTLWLLSHSLRHLDIHLKISAYTSYIRPQLEYATVISSPYLKKDIDRIEQVQKCFVKGREGYRNLPYDKALKKAHSPLT
ncbi:hypothetical protein QYM36_017344 [Artemia franciscana]|uniref:Uncharacterized protein n=1 Tax=Artemia franciscana TaxID=6661 RepID=A0AA88KX26_ARTSF|nr:hypothetical protein QYM36_017344 [Artemia franciscana]